jgi:hypothetical protein
VLSDDAVGIGELVQSQMHCPRNEEEANNENEYIELTSMWVLDLRGTIYVGELPWPLACYLGRMRIIDKGGRNLDENEYGFDTILADGWYI